MLPSQVGLLLAVRSLNKRLASLGAKGTTQPRGLGSGVTFRGMKKKAGGIHIRVDRDQSCAFCNGELGWKR